MLKKFVCNLSIRILHCLPELSEYGENMKKIFSKKPINVKAIMRMEDTYKGDLSDFQISITAPLFKYQIRKLCQNQAKNPIVILGKSASGKTLLATSISGEMKKHGKSSYRMTCERLMDAIIVAITTRTSFTTFIKGLSAYDFVFIDEIEELKGKESTQVEAAQVISLLIDNGVKVILLGLPGENIYEKLIKNLERNQKQTSIISIPVLTEYERRKYIEKTARKLGLKLPRAGIKQMAKNDSMATIVGMLNTLTAFSEKNTIVKKHGQYTYEDMELVLRDRFTD